MSRQIWKYKLIVASRQEIAAPATFHPLTVQVQGGFQCLWAIVDPDEPNIFHTINMRPTGGNLLGNEGRYLATVQDQSGFVWHIFVPVAEGETP